MMVVVYGVWCILKTKLTIKSTRKFTATKNQVKRVQFPT